MCIEFSNSCTKIIQLVRGPMDLCLGRMSSAVLPQAANVLDWPDLHSNPAELYHIFTGQMISCGLRT